MAPDGTGVRALGLLSGWMLLGAASVVAITLPLIEGVDNRWVYLAVVIAGLAGAAAFVLPWERLGRPALLVMPAVGLAACVYSARTEPAVLPAYLALYGVIPCYIGLSQRLSVLASSAVVVVAAYLFATAGSDTEPPFVYFLITFSVGLLMAVILNIAVARYRTVLAHMDQLRRVTRRLTRSTSTGDAVAIIETEVAEMAAADSIAVVLLDDREPGRPCHVAADGTWRELHLATGTALRELVQPLRAGEQVLLRDTSPAGTAVMVAAVDVAARSALCLPLLNDDGLLGTVVVAWTHTTRAVDGVLAQALGATADEAATVLNHHLRTERAERAANTDPLTGVRNRRALDERLCDLTPGDGVLVIDVDHFKEVNDERGHAAGDQVLRALAACLSASVRGTDLVARLGGDEFVVVLRDAGVDGCRKVARAVRAAWDGVDGGATISLGACANEGEPGTVTLARADGALYDAKSAGRDQSAFYGLRGSPRLDVNVPRDR